MRKALAISSAAHVAFLILVIVPGFGRARLPAMQVISVKLVGEEKPAPKKVEKVEKVEAAPPKPEPVKEPEEPKMTYKPKTQTRETEPAPAKKEEPKEEPKKEPAKAEAKSASAEAKPGVSGTTASGDKSSVRVDEENFKFAYYLEIVRESISYNWSPPPVPPSEDPVMTTVYFRIARDGQVSGVKVEEKSKFDLFDRSAVRAVNVSSPLPPLPAGFSGRWLGVHFEFEQKSG